MSHATVYHTNIVYVLADDMGYGDVRWLNPNCGFETPNLDRIGREGMVFTDAHSSSSSRPVARAERA